MAVHGSWAGEMPDLMFQAEPKCLTPVQGQAIAVVPMAETVSSAGWASV